MAVSINTQVGYERTQSLESIDRIPTRGTSVPGSIGVKVDGQTVVDHEYWDDIPDLWMDFVSGVNRVLRSGSGSVVWPDQPTKLQFETFDSGSTPYLRLWLEVADRPVPDRDVYAPSAEFFSKLAAEAMRFFDKYSDLDDSYRERFRYFVALVEAWWDEGLVERIEGDG